MTNPPSQNQISPPELWSPPQDISTTIIGRFMAFARRRSGQEFNDYQALHRWSVENLEEFWSAFWDFAQIMGDKAAQVMGTLPNVPWVQFFPDSKISYTENMLAHAADKPGEPAIIYRLQGEEDRVLNWQALHDSVSRWEQALAAEGLEEGDKISVYLPNIPETIIILLAASNLGIVFSSAGMEMGPADLINRFGQIQPQLLIATDGYVHGAKHISRLNVIARAQNNIASIQKTVLIDGQVDQGKNLINLKNTVKSGDFLSQFQPKIMEFRRRNFNHPLYILFSSGSTGKPKCFEHSTGGVLLKHLSEYMFHCDVKQDDCVFYHATPSWMMWNWLASGLGTGATILMYDGSPAYPDVYAQWDFTAAHNCTHHGTAAPVILSWATSGVSPTDRYDLSPLRMVMSTGAVLPAQGFQYIHTHVKGDVKIGSISGGTDIVGSFVGGNALTPEYAGQINGPMMGMDVQVWGEDGKRVNAGQTGELVCAKPFPSMPLRFLDDPDGSRYKAEYFEYFTAENSSADQPVWRHGDSVEYTPQGQLAIIGRSDATLNQNGVRIGTAAIYDQLAPFADQFKDCAAVDFTRPDNKQAITVLFLGMEHPEAGVPEDLRAAIKKAIKDNITPYAIPTEIIAVKDILKTPNGKKAEVIMKKILAGKNIPNASLYGEELVAQFEKIGKNLQTKYAGS